MERYRRANCSSLFAQNKTDAILSRSVAGATDLMVDAAWFIRASLIVHAGLFCSYL